MIVFCTGVCVRGLTRANICGSMPSRPMANRMRVWPYSVTRVTEKIEMTAPRARIVPQTVLPVTSSRICARPGLGLALEVLPRLGAHRRERDQHVER